MSILRSATIAATGETETVARAGSRTPDSRAEDARWRLALSAVIEETNGRLSYWALAHPPGKADFHHPDCFALELGPASRA